MPTIIIFPMSTQYVTQFWKAKLTFHYHILGPFVLHLEYLILYQISCFERKTFAKTSRK